MPRKKIQTKISIKELCAGNAWGRRQFIRNLAIGGGAVALLARAGTRPLAAQQPIRGPILSMVLVDFSKCCGCRTCETVCAAANHKEIRGGTEVTDLGNPIYANIRVYPFNPDIDVPTVCVMCSDCPCVAACPVDPDPKTGRKALFRNEKTLAIENDPNRCLACGSCAAACRSQRVGAIIPNPQTNRPERMCTLCGGDPQCVKQCPFGALSYIRGELDGRYCGLSPEEIARRLNRLWYGLQ